MAYGSVPHPGSGGSYSKGGILSYPAGVGVNAEFPHSIEFTARKRNLSSSNQKASTSLGSVVLYLPADALKTSYSQTFGDADLGAIGAATASIDETAAAGVVNQIDRTLRNVGAGRTDSAIASLSGALAEFKRGAGGVSVGNALAQATVNEALNRPGVGPIKDALFRKAGRIINPHKAVIYNGPGGFRTFSFTFVMMPKSEEEAEQVRKIVQSFKENMLPEMTDFGKGIGKSVRRLNIPNTFDIEYMYAGQSNSNLHRIGECVLESMSVSYGGDRYKAYDNGMPVVTNLSLNFKELDLITKERAAEGF